MKANLVHRFLREFLAIFAVFGFFFALPAMAQSDDAEEGEQDIVSDIARQTGLNLFERDKSDYCVENGLQIRVTVNGVTAEGILKLELFGEANFLKKKGKLRKIRVPAEEGSQKLCINVPLPGSYAVVGYHDRDGDRKLKKAWNFKPLEPYGLSNNPEIKALRLPKYSETSFDVPLTGVDIVINLVDLGADD
ncbi:uncharacterized protein DUF2141 [Litorimonas taeanensis]|uniref:Uncharacterized protein DUF2141 n=1 Tax=Litorimonas taeanensis TaxID=568099 RepID=A0A420WKK0_9PROT|nr:DUF2141 domain-containing protein [Litorimonas taeanensis]RKQ71553.1 uncharacterized protein DUF2141 [Litorimonas taeanensis]